MTVDEAKKYLAAGEFDEGTMAPKIEAAIDFIGDSAIRSVLITKLNKEGKTVSGGMGTLITKQSLIVIIHIYPTRLYAFCRADVWVVL